MLIRQPHQIGDLDQPEPRAQKRVEVIFHCPVIMVHLDTDAHKPRYGLMPGVKIISYMPDKYA